MHPLKDLYLHFPFCTGRCGYCAFVSGPPPQHPIAYIDSLVAEARQRSLTFAPLQTLYCGGGTPGLIGSAGFKALSASSLFTFAQGYEWTVELHPRTVTAELLETLATCGVTRLSIGVQSLDDEVLNFCNRRHTAQEALEAVQLARTFIPDTGIDLIAGLPGVDAPLWQETLARCIDLDLPHLSIYALSIDEGSIWEKRDVSSPDAEAVCDAIALASARLAEVGLQRYETSNYAREGYRCQHNLNTWHGGNYAGLGRGAASRIGRMRRAGDGTEEPLNELDDALERALTQLRLDEGFCVAACIERFPCLAPYAKAWATILADFHQHGLLTATYAPTTRGYEILDALERALLECVYTE